MSAKWWTLMMTSVTPKVPRRERVISSRVRPATSTRALGRLSVSGRRRVPRPAARIMAFMEGPSLERSPFAQLLQLKMPHRHFQTVPGAQTLGQLLGKEDGAMLASRAAERDHQTLETATLIIADAGVHKGHNTSEKLMHALLLDEVVDYRDVLARQMLKALFASGIREAAAIENESAAMPGFVLRQAPVK